MKDQAELVALITAKQEQLGMSDGEFSTMLGIPRSTWQLTRTGVKPLGRRVAEAAGRTFRDLRDDARIFLVRNATSLTECDTEVAYGVK